MANTIQIKRTTDSTCNDAVVSAGELVWSDEHASSGGANGKLYIGDTGGVIRHIGGVGSGAVAGVINNATADELVTVASTITELDAEATLTYNTTDGLGLSTSSADVPFTMTNTETTGTSCAHLKMVKDGVDVAANESLGKITVYGDDSGGDVTQYGEIEFRVNDKTAGDESGKVQIDVATSDSTNTSMKQAFYAVGHATSEYVDTTLGYGTSSTCTVAGNIDVDGTANLDAVDIDGAVQVDGTITVGEDDTGYDVKFFGDTASAYMLWDTSTDDLVLAGAAGLDIAGDIDVDGTANLDVVDIDGATQADGTITVGEDDTGYDVKFFGATSGAYMLWNASADDLELAGAAGLDIAGNIEVDGTAHLDEVDIDGATQVDGTITVGADDIGYDVQFFGATSGAYMLWDESADDLVLAGAAGLVIPDGGNIGSASDTDAVAISSAGVVALSATTEASAVDTAALTVAGGLGVAKDLWLGDDLTLDSDSAVLSFGDDQDTTLTHTDGTGLTLNGANKLCFRDSAVHVSSDADGYMNVQADTGVNINVNGTDELSIVASTATFGTNLMLPDGATIGVASDADSITIASSGDVTLSQDLTVAGSLNVTGSVLEVDSTSMVVKDKELWLGVPGGVIEKTYSRSNGTTTATITSANHGLNEGEEVLIVGAAGTQDGIYTILTGGSFTTGVFEITTTETTAISAEPIWHSVQETQNSTANGAGLYVAGNVEGGDPLGAQGWTYDYSPSPTWETKIGIKADARDNGAVGFKVLNPLTGTDVGTTISDFDGTHTGVEDNHAQLHVLGNTTTTSSNTADENNTTGLLVAPQGNTIPADTTATVVSSAAFFEPVINVAASGAVVTNAATVYIASVPTEGTNNYALYGTGAIGGFTMDGGTF